MVALTEHTGSMDQGSSSKGFVLVAPKCVLCPVCALHASKISPLDPDSRDPGHYHQRHRLDNRENLVRTWANSLNRVAMASVDPLEGIV